MLDLLMNRRSIRKFTDKEVEKEKLDIILKAALTSPSGKNKKPWELIVIKDQETLRQLGASRGGASLPISNSKLAIAVVANPDVSDTWVEDSSIIATIIQLTSQSLGLGSVWIQVRNRVTEDQISVGEHVRNILSIPNDKDVLCIIPIGYPNEEKKPYDEDALPFDKVHYEKF